MAGSSTADLRLRPTRDDDVGFVLLREHRDDRPRALYRSEGFVEEGTLRDALYDGAASNRSS